MIQRIAFLLLLLPCSALALEQISLPESESLLYCPTPAWDQISRQPSFIIPDGNNNPAILSGTTVSGAADKIAVNHDRTLIALGHPQGAIDLIAITEKTLQRRFRITVKGEVNKILFHPNRPYLFILSDGGRTLSLVNTETSLRRRLPPVITPVTAFAVTANGNILAVAHFDGTLRLYDLVRNRQIGTPFPLEEQIERISFHPSEQQIALVTIKQKLLVFDYRRGEPVQAGFALPGKVIALAFTDSRNILLGIASHGVYQYSIDTHNMFNIAGSRKAAVNGTSFTASSALAITTSQSGYVSVYDVKNGMQVFQCGHTGFIESYDVNSEEMSLISAGSDGRISLWNLRNNSLIATAQTRPSAHLQTVILNGRQSLLIRQSSKRSVTDIDLIQWNRG